MPREPRLDEIFNNKLLAKERKLDSQLKMSRRNDTYLLTKAIKKALGDTIIKFIVIGTPLMFLSLFIYISYLMFYVKDFVTINKWIESSFSFVFGGVATTVLSSYLKNNKE